MKKFSNNANIAKNLILGSKMLGVYSKVVILDEIYKCPNSVRHYKMKSREFLDNKTVVRQLNHLLKAGMISKWKNTYFIKEEQKVNIHSLFTALIRIGMTKQREIPTYAQYSA